ncbi:MAG TPA: carbon-nitrogen hydrolase family protein [Cyclobacteriaceae bacterium]|nr:carbon-nitrogen hydrolase family protein [Cyclobacteriaceae bacterium]
MKRKLIYLSSAIVIIVLNCLTGFSQSSNQKVRLACLQMNATPDIQKNKERIIEGLRKASGEGAAFLITPEGSLSGYTSNFDQDEVSKALPEILAIAKQVKVGLFLGTCFKEISGNATYCYNQIRVYTPVGEFLGAYSKILRCSPLNLPGTGEMVDYVEGELKIFEWKGHKIGTLICNDLWATPGYTTIPNPYLAWKLKQMGADMIIHCINSGSNQRYRKFHESSAELWALSLKIPILEVNAAQGDETINAMSGLIGADGIRSKTVPDTGDQFFIVDLP